MDYSFTLKEYAYFIKYNIKTIVATMVVTIGLIMGGYVYSQYFNADSAQTPQTPTEQVVFDTEQMHQLLDENFDALTPEQQNQLLQFLESESYYFRVYIEDQNAEPYNHFRTLKEILTTKELSTKIEEEIQAEFKPDSKRGVILGIEPTTNIITIKVGVGNPELNQEIAQIYFDMLKSDEFDFIKNKTVYFIDTEPMLTSAEDNELEPEEIINQGQSSGIGTLIVLTLISVIAGFVLGILVSLVKNMFSKKISYLFDYKLSGKDSLYKFDEDKNGDDFVYTIVNPKHTEKLIVSEEPLEKNTIEKLKQSTLVDLVFVNDLAENDSSILNMELVILTKLNQTNKRWYLEQLRKGAILNIPVKVVQI
ncbi:hypothetical protein [Jeotgalibaca sp. A122]|uniref:hypothetical protein n=1 Tax=Jeotgalibaca sp. A122 TaxID=3457322 RepID=UPI003FD2720E